MNIQHIILKPLLTEKATGAAAAKQYTFEVNRNANKHHVKQALEQLYGVKVASVTMSVRKGKVRRVGRRMMPKQMADRKIAVARVTEGVINVFPQA